MSEVLFITPNLSGFVSEEPVGTLLLSTILRNAGIQTDILQFHHFGSIDSFRQFIDCATEMICAKAPRIVSFYTRCDTYHISLKIAQQIKAKAKDIYIVFGGPQADLSAEDTLREIPYVDYICCGEGENTIVPFFSSLLSGVPDITIPGLVFRAEYGIVKNPRPEATSDLDSLPIIDYSLLNLSGEALTSSAKRLFPVDVGRGCPFVCTYCSTNNFWGRNYRLKSAARIVEEIRYIHQKFGISGFVFEHDMFTLNREKVIQICQMLKTIGFPLHWRCSARIDCLDEGLIDIMADAGMDGLFLGIESGSPRMQKLIKKNLRLENILQKLKYISDKGITIKASFIFGFPEETEEDFSQTVSLMAQICKLPHTLVQHHLCTFFPGTELTTRYRDALVKSSVISDITNELAVSDCEDIIHAHPVLFPHFYEYKTELREKTKYFPLFFTCWRALSPVYEYIAATYYDSRLCDMVFDFSRSNHHLLSARMNYTDVLKQDRFLDSFSHDDKYNLLKEVSRFLVWKPQAPVGSTEVFGFDVKALISGSEITDLQETLTIVSCVKGSNGKRGFTFSTRRGI